MHKHISFVRPLSEDQELCDIKSEPDRFENGQALSGEEAKAFYDELLGLPSTSYPHPVFENPSTINLVDSSDDEDVLKQSVSNAKPKDLLMFAQNGQHRELKRLLISTKLDVNLQDSYGWTALHCAAYEGHLSCIKTLLKFGSSVDLKDNKGRTALELCKRRKNHSAFHLIRSYGKEDNRALKKELPPPNILKCSLCKTEYDSNQTDRHLTSIVHRAAEDLNSRTSYGIPEGNVGFRMLESMGWDKETGLGSESQGRKFPVKTKLKRDRKGLGLSKEKARVTHFDPNDASAVQHPSIEMFREKLRQKRQSTKDRNLERDFRRAFY